MFFYFVFLFFFLVFFHFLFIVYLVYDFIINIIQYILAAILETPGSRSALIQKSGFRFRSLLREILALAEVCALQAQSNSKLCTSFLKHTAHYKF